MDQKRLLKEIRKKYGEVKTIKRNKYRWPCLSSRYAEENIACGLSILHDPHCNQEWVRNIKEKIGFCSTGGCFDL